MPTRPPKACAKFGCNKLTPFRYCVEHERERREKRAKRSNWSKTSRHSRGYGTAWDALRRHVLDRDQGWCQWCKAQGAAVRATDVDHIQPKSEGGTDMPENLQSLCPDCHKLKTQTDNRRQREKRRRR